MFPRYPSRRHWRSSTCRRWRRSSPGSSASSNTRSSTRLPGRLSPLPDGLPYSFPPAPDGAIQLGIGVQYRIRAVPPAVRGMIMKILRVLAGIAVAGALSFSAHAQSLGDAAREARAEKPATPQTKVFTNDNLPTTGAISVMGTAAPTPSASSSDKAAKPAAAATAPDPAAKQKEADKIKDQIESQKGEISRLERELDISTREWKLRQAAYYADAGNQLRDPAAWAATERKYNDETAQKKQDLDAAKQKLDDLQEQARKTGMSSAATE